jgi:hypothetical protein
MIQTANRCFCGLRKHLRSSHLARQTKLMIYKTKIRTVLLYGSGTADKNGIEPIARFWEQDSPHDIWPKNIRRCVQEQVHLWTRWRVQQPKFHRCHEEQQIVLIRWRHDKMCQKLTTESRVGRQTKPRKKDRSPGGRMAWLAINKAVGARDWTNFALNRVKWRDLFRQALTKISLHETFRIQIIGLQVRQCGVQLWSWGCSWIKTWL